MPTNKTSPIESKTFRVFVSSTFSDMKAERNILQNDVFKRLDAYCSQHGAQFQAIDLRWGINEEDQLDHQTMDLCLSEIKHCQRISPKPNFIVLLGDRYGWQPIPARIPSSEMAILLNTLNDRSEDEILLREWYREDLNAIPAEYVLQQRKGVLQQYEAWEPIENRLREVLRNAVSQAELTNSEKVKFFASATHQEILKGALHQSKDDKDSGKHVFAYLRNVKGMPQNENAKSFIDIKNGKPDPFAQKQLTHLRHELKEKLGEDHCYEYHANWQNNNLALKDSIKFAETVYEQLKTVIDTQIQEMGTNDLVEQERKLHKDFRERLIEHFKGREQSLSAISSYLNFSNDKVLALVGASGSGKSSVMAKAITEAKTHTGIITYRFLGTTTRSSDTISLLESLCDEITFSYGTNVEDLFCDEVDEKDRSGKLKQLYTPNGIKELFRKSLALATEEKPLLLFFDALDQLSNIDKLTTLSWIPQEILPNVSFVVSCLPELENRLQFANKYQLEAMPVVEAGEILDGWLSSGVCKRTLTIEQRRVILSAFEQNHLPIFLRLAFEKAKKWHSYDPFHVLPTDVQGMLKDFFDQLEKQHTTITVSKAVGYMLSGRFQGLEEKEILDMLVQDKEHWQTFLERTHSEHLNEVQKANKLPIAVWSRLYFDLEIFLTVRNVYGKKVLAFFHRQFREYTIGRYCKNEERINRHQQLAEYYRSKPAFLDKNNRTIPNIRKSIELPFQFMNGAMWNELIEDLSRIFLVEAIAKTKALDILQQDLEQILGALPQSKKRKSISNFYTVFIKCKRIINEYPEYSFQHLYNELQWLSPPIAEYAKQAYKAFIENDGILLHHYNKPKFEESNLIKIFEAHQWHVNSCRFSPDGKKIVTASDDHTLKIWDAEQGNELHTLVGHVDKVKDCEFSPDSKKIVSVSKDNTISIWDAITGMELKIIKIHQSGIYSCSYSPCGKYILSGSLNSIKLNCASSGKELFTHNCRAIAIAYSKDGNFFASSTSTGLKIWCAKSFKCLAMFKIPSAIRSCAFSPDSNKIIIGHMNGNLEIWCISTEKCLKTINAHNSSIYSCSFSPNGKWIVSASGDKTIKIWSANSFHQVSMIQGNSDFVLSCNFSPNSKYLVSAGLDNSIKMWSLKETQQQRKSIGHKKEISSIKFSPDGKYVVTASFDKTLKVWDLKKGIELFALTGHDKDVKSCSYSPDGKRIVSASADKSLKIWDLEKKCEIKTLMGHDNKVVCCSYSPDGKHIVSASDDGTLRIWDAEKGNLHLEILGYERGFTLNCQYSIDGKHISGEAHSFTRIHNSHNGKVMKSYNDKFHSFSPNGINAVVSSNTIIKIINWKNGRFFSRFNEHSEEISSCSFSPDGKLMISASGGQYAFWMHKGKGKFGKDPILRIWSIEKEKCIQSYNENKDASTSTIFFPDSQNVLSVSNDKTAKIFNPNTGKTVAMFYAPKPLWKGVINGTGDRIVCADHDGGIYFLKPEGLNLGKPIVTPSRLWNNKNGKNAAFSPNISIVCPSCGTRFITPQNIIDTIMSIHSLKQDFISENLLVNCPNCQKGLKVNPFYIDNMHLSFKDIISKNLRAIFRWYKST